MKTAAPAIALAAVMLCAPANAEQARPKPDPLVQLHQWLWPRKSVPVPAARPTPPAARPTLVAPVQPAPISKAEPARPKPAPAERAKPKSKQEQPQKRDEGKGISCADARRGVGMACILIRANAYIYEAYTEKQKRQARACLTAAERAAIASCFK